MTNLHKNICTILRNRIPGSGIFCLLIFISLKASAHRSASVNDSLPRYYSFFKGEVKPEPSKKCFDGAYYRKLVSAKDHWLGISGTVILPSITYDPARVNPAKPGQFLDNASVYLGGSMDGQETDIGLIWEVIRDEQGKVSTERKAFRPFLRRTAHSGGQAAVYLNAPAKAAYYWYPGEEVKMSVQIISDGKLKFIVEGAGKRFEQDFDCEGYGVGKAGEFKRVNAIDQVANEGKPVTPTKTRVENAVWKETNLYRLHKNEVILVPFHSLRYTEMQCPDTLNFDIKATEADKRTGAERININGAKY